jgi:GNAT superfamily N-acetyltransferase
MHIDVLTPEHRDRWLAFFDGPAFADNPQWGTCYCRCLVFGARGYDAWDQACAQPQENRAAMSEAIARGEIDGLLARRGEQTVGWLHMGPAQRFVSPRGPLFTPPDPQEAAIVCFLIAPGHRRTGVARAMLTRACTELAGRGFRSVSALATRDSAEEAMDQFTGPLALFESLGFVPAEVPAAEAKRIRVTRLLGSE